MSRSPLLLTVSLGLLLAGCPSTDEPEPQPTPEPDDILANHDGFDDLDLLPLPTLFVSPENPPSGTPVEVVLSGEGTVTLAVSGPGCGSLAGGGGAMPLTLTGAAGARGECDVVADGVDPDGTTWTYGGRFVVQATDPVLPPIEVVGGVYLPETPPRPTPDGTAPRVVALDGPTTFHNGGTVQWTVVTEGAEPGTALLVELDGYPGWFRVPVASNPPTLRVRFAHDIFDRLRSPARDAGSVTMKVAMLGRWDHFVAHFTQEVVGTEVGDGEVAVGVEWNTATDVDLHVVEPSGEEIYYGHPSSATGGALDLDSNPGCNIDGVNAEHVSWPLGASPSGVFTARLRMYDDCGLGGASGSVTITYCGEDSPLEDTFSLGATGSEDSWTFESDCSYTVRGRVRYEDRPVTKDGLGPGVLIPARRVTVQVIQASDESVVAEGVTDDAGNYDLGFHVEEDTPGTRRYSVRVVAFHAGGGFDVSAWSGAARYAWVSRERTDAVAQPDRTGLDLDIEATEGAGALNLFDVALKSHLFALGTTGRGLPALEIHWTSTTRQRTRASADTVYVSGGSDPDEYDDGRVAHEFGHMLLEAHGEDDSWGPAHYPYERTAPAVAWSEGFAHWFGAASQNTSWYANTVATGLKWYLSLDRLPSPAPLGSAGHRIDGDLSEFVPAGVLYDLHDTTNERYDTVTGRTATIARAVFVDLGPSSTRDRGAPGRDLVDFLDAWVRGGYGDVGAVNTEGLRGNVYSIHEFLGYDFAPPP